MRPEEVAMSIEDNDDEAPDELEDKVSELAHLIYGLPKNLKVKLEFEIPASHKLSVSKMHCCV